VAGSLSDRIGRTLTLALMLGFQAILMFMAIPVVGAVEPSAVLIVLIATGIGFNYGTNLALFPALSKDYWGLKNFGVNYGLLFTAWGMGGFVLGRASEMMKVATGSYTMSFGVAGTMLAVATLALMLKDLARQMKENRKAEPAPVAQATLQQPVLEEAA
jgi:nitrate/nitrite transporter NarK